MPRLPNNPDRDFSAGQSEDDISMPTSRNYLHLGRWELPSY